MTHPTIVSFTLANEHAPALHDALASVAPFVDACLVVWTGKPRREVAPLLGMIPDVTRSPRRQIHLREWAWCNDFGAARNAALDFAAEADATWGCMVDSDERVICPDPTALRDFLSALPPRVVVGLAHSADGSHTRERFFRLPCPYKFNGRTHEMMSKGEDEQVIIPREFVQWTELPKSPEQLRAKFERDVTMLRADLADDPGNGAAWYYLGSSLQSLGQHEEAIDAFRRHNALSRWEEGRAWAAFKAAESYFALGQPYRVLECAAQGLVHDAGMAELYWIAALACLAHGWWEQARCFACSAKLFGEGSEAERRRVGHRDVRGLRNGPDDVLAAVRVATEKPVTGDSNDACEAWATVAERGA